MHAFKDAKGREWEITANFATYSRVKSKCDVNLTDIVEEDRKCLRQLADPFVLGDVVWCMVERQAEARGVTRDDFGAGLDGDAWEAASRALMDEMVFFCRPSVRPMLEMTIRKTDEAIARMHRQMPQMMQAAESEIDAMFDTLTRGSSGTSSPESSESTPQGGRSASSSGRRRGSSATSGTTRRRR